MIFYLAIMVRTLRRFPLDTNLTKWLSVKVHIRKAREKDNYMETNDVAEIKSRNK